MATYRVLETPPIPMRPEDAELMASVLQPLFEEYWFEKGEQIHNGKKFWFDSLPFMFTWGNGGFLIIVAYDDDDAQTPIGVLLAGRVQPIMYKSRILQIDTLYGRTREIEEGLMKVFREQLPVLSPDEVVIPSFFELKPGVVDGQRKEDFPYIRYIRR